MKRIEVGASPKQVSRLRNGHRVRVKPVAHGSGVCLIVDPSRYDLISRTFSRGKGLEIALLPNEIEANKADSVQMEGTGIFGKKFDRKVRKTVGKTLQKKLYGLAERLKPAAKAALIGVLGSAGAALSAAQPELVPFVAPGVTGLATMGVDYIDRPSYYQSQDGQADIQSKLSKSAKAEINRRLPQQQYQQQQQQQLDAYYANMFDGIEGNGLYAASGTGIRKMSKSRCGGAVGLKGGLVSQENVLPPALRSQPLSANYQFRHTLQPALVKKNGSGLML